ncbi:MAG: VWA domain-containing protein [Thermoplasmata archaeon]|nr:MAG: VWA domain-containing protein [Thermoplasmata archaeon]
MKKSNMAKKGGLYKRFSSVFMIIIVIFSGTLTLFPVLYDDAIQNAEGIAIDNIFFDDMEPGGPAYSGQWTVMDAVPGLPPPPSASQWELGTPMPPPNAYSPSNVWGTELMGPYQTMSECILITPTIDLSYIDPKAILGVKLTFFHWYNFSKMDGGWVEVNPTQFNLEPDPLEPEGGYPGMVLSWRGSTISGYAGSNGDWELATFDLSDYIGQSITIGFHFCGYYGDMTTRGWYIDDVLVEIERIDGPFIESDQEKVGMPGDTLSYILTVTNFNSSADFIDLRYFNIEGWYVEILNSTTYLPLESIGGDPRYPDVYLLPNASIDIVVNITIPTWISGWDVSDTTTIYAILSSAPYKLDTVELIARTPFPDVAILDISSPSPIQTGNTVTVVVTVINNDDWPYSFYVEGEVSGPMINPPSTLEPQMQFIADLLPKSTTTLIWNFIPDISCRYNFTATTLLDIDQVEYNNKSSLNIDVLEIEWSDDMEAGGDASFGLWDNTTFGGPQTKWELGTPSWSSFPPDGPPAGSLPSPDNCWGTDLDAAYQVGTDCYLFTPASSAFDFSGRYLIYLTFYHWLKLNNISKGDYVEIVYTLDPAITTIYSTGIKFEGVSNGWELISLDLSEFVKNEPYVRFGWRLRQGASGLVIGIWPGWYIDDVAVWSTPPRADLIITEIVDSGGDEYIEVFNRGKLPAYLLDYGITLDRGSSYLNSGDWATPMVMPGGYTYYSIPSGMDELNDQGETIYIVNTSTTQELITDQLSYGQNGWVPDPIPGESVARYWDGGGYADIWARDPFSTIGSQNDAPGEVSPKYVVLNEVLYNPTYPSDGFIELIYVGEEGDPNVDVLNWLLVVGDSVIPIPSGTYSTILNPSNPFYIIDAVMIPGLFGSIDVNGDNIYLYTDSGEFVDEVGWNLPHIPDTSMSRVPDGFGISLNGKPFGLMGYDDLSSIAAGWVFERLPTIPYILVGPDSEGRNFPGEYANINLTVENRQFVGDLIEIFNFTENGFFVEIYDATNTIKLSDSDGDGTPDLWLDGQNSINITIRVHIPETFPIPDENNVTIYIQSDTNEFIGDFAFLKVILYPYLEPQKSIAPSSIFVEGTGYGEEAQIRLGIKGSGSVIPGVMRNAADIVFVVDDTGSMGDDIDQVKEDIDYIVDRILENITSVRFGLVTYKDKNDIDYDVPLTFDVDEFKQGVWDMVAEGGGDYEEAVKDALKTARDDSDWRDDPVVRMMILMGDADPHDPDGACAVADDAYTNHGIYTNVMDASPLGLQSFIDIAEAGRGVYEHVGNSQEMADAIINAILYLVPPVDIAGFDINQDDSDYMVQDVLPDYINYVPGSFSIEPDNIINDAQGRTILQWNIERIRIGEKWSVTFSITATALGLVDSNDFFLSRVNYTRWDNSSKTSLFPRTQVLVKLTEPSPPELYIDVVDDFGNLDGKGNNIRLRWDPPDSLFTAYYLIYRSENQTDFNFSTPWVRTDVNYDNGICALRTTFNDTNVSDIVDSNYHQQMYYTIRAVNIAKMVSQTSRTVGKWTKTFEQGVSTFSLPLEPLQPMQTDDYTNDMNAEYIKYIDDTSHIWKKHNYGDGTANNVQMNLGKGFEVKFACPTKYTFCGMPGAMIQYDNASFVGFDHNSDAKNLTARVDGTTGDIILNWARPFGMSVGVDFYFVYYSDTRDGFWGLLGTNYKILGKGVIYAGTETAIHTGAAQAGTQFYYMVVPVLLNGLQFGASSYSIGVWTGKYSMGYDTLGIPLKPDCTHTTDWYCDAIPNVWGMNYYNVPGQRWMWHKTIMPKGAYDVDVVMTEGYQISTINTTKYTFIGL